MKNTALILSLFTLLFSSCFVIPVAPLPEDSSKRAVIVPLEFNEITIVDKRSSSVSYESVASRKVAAYNPPLSENMKTYITNKIKSTSDIEGYITNAEFRLIQGDAQLSKDFSAQEEIANIEVQIYVEIPEMRMSYTSSSSIDYTWPSLNPNREHLEILYNLGLKNALQMALEQLSEGIIKQLEEMNE